MAANRGIAITATQLEPIQRQTVMDLVGRRIEQLLRSGDLKAGDRLPPEPELAHVARLVQPHAPAEHDLALVRRNARTVVLDDDLRSCRSRPGRL